MIQGGSQSERRWPRPRQRGVPARDAWLPGQQPAGSPLPCPRTPAAPHPGTTQGPAPRRRRLQSADTLPGDLPRRGARPPLCDPSLSRRFRAPLFWHEVCLSLKVSQSLHDREYARPPALDRRSCWETQEKAVERERSVAIGHPCARLACFSPMAGTHYMFRGTRRMETCSLAPSLPLIVPDDRPFGQAPASGTGRHPGAAPGVEEGGKLSQPPPAVGTRGCRRGHRTLTWGVLGLLVSVAGGVSWRWHQPPRMPPRPPIHHDLAASALSDAAVLTPPSALVARPPAQRQPPAGLARLEGTLPTGTSPGLPLQPPAAALAEDPMPRAKRVGRPPHARKRQALPRPRMRVRGHQGGASHPRAWSAPLPAPPPSARWNVPTPAPQGERPWLWHALPATGDG